MMENLEVEDEFEQFEDLVKTERRDYWMQVTAGSTRKFNEVELGRRQLVTVAWNII